VTGLDCLRRLLDAPRFEPDFGLINFIYLYLPEQIEAGERHQRYEAPLDAELQLAKIGRVSGGGTMLNEEEADDSRDILWCGVDVDVVDVPAARTLLRDHLPSLGCKAGTRIEFGEAGDAYCDTFDGTRWNLRVQQSPDEGGG
jgi:hypothetical protein